MDDNTKRQNRIDELIAELSDCRDDERNSQSQILEVISVVSTILGILFGSSYLKPESKDKEILIFQNIDINSTSYVDKFCNIINENITYPRILFWISLVVFCMAFAYIIVLGIDNVLRYYYIQNIEDRLNQLISSTPDNKDRGEFLHWNEYSAPITTKNIKHITSTHTALSYGCYSLAIICVILFSIGIVLSLYFEINDRKWFDKLILWIVIIGMGLAFILFTRLTVHAKKVSQFAWDTAHKNQKIRLDLLQGNLYDKGKSFRRLFIYFIYPKRQDLQKPLLIIVGFVYGVVIRNCGIDLKDVFNIILTIFVFDFLAYQARYQINDIRGLDEDKESGYQNRLLSNDIDNPEHVIKISFIIAIFKILVALFVTIHFSGAMRKRLLISLIILFISTVLYEYARDRKNTWLIFIFVGVGYPLRFCMGFLTATQEWKMLTNEQIAFFILALLTYGSFSSILAWVNEVADRIQKSTIDSVVFKKKHYEDIWNIITDRYILAEKNPIDKKIIPLREKCNVKDPWNIMMFFSLISTFFIACFGNIPVSLIIIEIVVCITFILNINFSHKRKLILFGISWGSMICKSVIGMIYYKMPSWYLLLSIMQVLITVTYFILCYQPQVKKIDFRQLLCRLKYKIMIKVLGKYAVDIMENAKKKTKK